MIKENSQWRITRAASIWIWCVSVGVFVIAYAIFDYEYRVYSYRYLPSSCKIGSSCPFPAINDMLLWIGGAIIITGITCVIILRKRN